MTTPFDNPQAELAWTFLQCLCQGGDLDECFGLLSDDFTYWSVVTRAAIGKATLRREIDQRNRRVETALDLIRCVTDGDSVVIEAQSEGVTADGVPYASPYVFLFETRDGLIHSLREYSNTRLVEEVFT
ncbi:nuclear transport factor 2 family protein [Mycobacterium sp. SM1]|uniref:nuclear transport factor 2 family protein n=1 Tax=Mycobacterium sp. SM1 TaxID=2816243 RepID=UPI001BCAD4A4|nr:nuclear transport factor 2 family protein [Mycobacterium sp. SM1]MBS4727877.1 nuclear transport factor 2 family protein [Mycobacterium sp. SM1]